MLHVYMCTNVFTAQSVCTYVLTLHLGLCDEALHIVKQLLMTAVLWVDCSKTYHTHNVCTYSMT